MATACTFCGQDLPRDDAHFCNSCGMLVPSHPFSAQSLSAASSAKPPTRKEPEKPVLREQMVQQPTQKPVLREQMVQQPRQRTTRRIAPDNLASPIAWPAPITHVSVKGVPVQKENEHVVPQEPQPVQNMPKRSVSPERELHVKVWEQNNLHTPLPPLPESTVGTPPVDIEDVPTSSLTTPEQLHKENPSSNHGNETSQNNVEYLDTVPMQKNYAHAQTPQNGPHSSRSMRGDTPLPALPVDAQKQRQQGYTNTPIPYSNMPRQPAPMSQASQYSAMRNTSASTLPVKQEKRVASPASTARHQKSRVPFIILLALLFILILGGGAWVLLAQPFSISPVTQPLQDFKDTGLGVALSYPNSWTVQHAPTSVIFSDSSHTAQVKLQVANDTSDATQYVQQQATKSGMTAIKPLGTTSFAGLSWQQVQGNLQQNGANYTTTLLAAVRGNHMYVLTQMAPQNVYADEESVVFLAMRNSFKFL